MARRLLIKHKILIHLNQALDMTVEEKNAISEFIVNYIFNYDIATELALLTLCLDSKMDECISLLQNMRLEKV
jgi:hypothetical protein